LTGPIGVAVPDARPTTYGTTRLSLRFGKVRGLWVVRFSLAMSTYVQAVVDQASRAGFNTMMGQVRGRGDAFHTSSLEPRGGVLAAQPAAFDPLQEIIAAAHTRG
jgi:uncharacterized lipoprotein YddW (UPF0748 family)